MKQQNCNVAGLLWKIKIKICFSGIADDKT